MTEIVATKVVASCSPYGTLTAMPTFVPLFYDLVVCCTVIWYTIIELVRDMLDDIRICLCYHWSPIVITWHCFECKFILKIIEVKRSVQLLHHYVSGWGSDYVDKDGGHSRLHLLPV